MFLTKNDLFSHIDEKLVNQLSRYNDNTVDEILLTAEATVKEYLMQLYDVEAVFSTTGADRPKRAVWWCCCIASWMLYKKAQVNTPENIKVDYQDCLLTLERICDAKQPADLPRRVNTEGEPKTKFRWGSQPKRSH
jgi:phage gp36-like protein